MKKLLPLVLLLSVASNAQADWFEDFVRTFQVSPYVVGGSAGGAIVGSLARGEKDPGKITAEIAEAELVTAAVVAGINKVSPDALSGDSVLKRGLRTGVGAVVGAGVAYTDTNPVQLLLKLGLPGA